MKRFTSNGQVWFGAALNPIDWWPGWTSIEEFREKYRELFEWNVDYMPEEMKLGEVTDIARQLGWEGDGDWKCAPLPTDDGYCKMMYAVKQSNNGTTFVVSPFNFAWL